MAMAWSCYPHAFCHEDLLVGFSTGRVGVGYHRCSVSGLLRHCLWLQIRSSPSSRAGELFRKMLGEGLLDTSPARGGAQTTLVDEVQASWG